MVGFINIQVTEHGYAVDMDLNNVSLQDKLECMHCVAAALEMDPVEMAIYMMAENSGLLKDAESLISCKDDEELQKLLNGGEIDEHQS